MGTTTVSNLEDLLRRLPDVTACRVRTDASGAVVAAYVTATGARPATEVAADVVTVLVAEGGLDVDPARVHVTVMPPPPEAANLAVLEELEHEGRARWAALRTSTRDEESCVEVELVYAGATAIGSARARGAAGAADLTAAAVLDALEKICAGRCTLRVASVLRDGDVTRVSVQEADGREVRVHVGAARSDDPARAAGSAALAALNRRLGRILAGPPRQFRIA
jgi:hypothetical protein